MARNVLFWCLVLHLNAAKSLQTFLMRRVKPLPVPVSVFIPTPQPLSSLRKRLSIGRDPDEALHLGVFGLCLWPYQVQALLLKYEMFDQLPDS